MSRETKIYSAFTGISPWERSAVLRFLSENTEQADPHEIQEAVEYALKNRPSFGGFLLTILEDQQIVAAVVANRTGMEGYNPKHLFVYVALVEEYLDDEELVGELLHQALRQANGEVALHVKPGHPALKLYEKLGFTAQYLGLRFRRTATA